MSLLIKALQKAEQGKSEAVEGASSNALAAQSKPEIELAPRHENLSSDLKEEGGFDGEAQPATLAKTQRQAAASAVFRAHQQPASSPGNARAFWLAGGGAVLLLLLGIGFYMYLDSIEQPEVEIPRHISPLPQPEPVVTAPVASAVEPSVAPESEEPRAPAPEAPVVAKEENIKEAPLVTRTAPVQSSGDPKSKAADETAVKVTRNRAPAASVNDQVMAGYQAYMAGDDAVAGRYYRQAVQSEPRNSDALLGLAAVSVRQGKTEEATALYMRVLELEPRNPSAQSGLISLASQSDPAAAETRLKNLIGQQPDAAFLQAALGNLYADQGQWATAQQAYFQAFRLESTNAEYAYNLAASLDQMVKPDLALNYYQKALELMPRQGGVIDRAQIEARIGQLRTTLNK